MEHPGRQPWQAHSHNFALIGPMSREIAQLEFDGKVKTGVEEPGQAQQELDFGAWQATVAYGFPQPDGRRTPGTKDAHGVALVAQLGPDEFLVTGIDASVSFTPARQNCHGCAARSSPRNRAPMKMACGTSALMEWRRDRPRPELPTNNRKYCACDWENSSQCLTEHILCPVDQLVCIAAIGEDCGDRFEAAGTSASARRARRHGPVCLPNARSP